MAQAMNYKLLRANNLLSQLAQHAVFARMQDSIARRQQRVDDLSFRLAQAQSRLLKSWSQRLNGQERQLRQHDPRMRLAAMRRQLDSHSAEVNAAVHRMLVRRRTNVEQLTTALSRASETVLLRRRSRWERLHSGLHALSPKAILARGYALVFDQDGRLVKQPAQLKTGDQVRTQLARGEFTSEVKQVKDEEESS
jgi:exodeoxyribonuclease VII large subunit